MVFGIEKGTIYIFDRGYQENIKQFGEWVPWKFKETDDFISILYPCFYAELIFVLEPPQPPDIPNEKWMIFGKVIRVFDSEKHSNQEKGGEHIMEKSSNWRLKLQSAYLQ